MGMFINLGNYAFKSARNGEYIDKSGLIAEINKVLNTENRMSCVSRCRRFGKSMAAGMLCAYYDYSCDSRELFADLEIANDPTFEKHLNKYPVIYLDMTYFTTKYGHCADMVDKITKRVLRDLCAEFTEIEVDEDDGIMDYLLKVSEKKGLQFIMIIDEWDAICREFQGDKAVMDSYVSLLRHLFKEPNTPRVFAGVYMTGILPIKKYNTESALNNFREYTVFTPKRLAPYFGFTREEVVELCNKHGMNIEELEKWYDGYAIGNQPSMFNPSSVMQCIFNMECRSYWASTGAFDSVARYIQMNYEGLKDDIISMLGGAHCRVDYTSFRNDLSQVETRNEVLTVLIHLGYLSYEQEKKTCFIPNMEVRGEMKNAVEASKWKEVINAIEESDNLLESLLEKDADAVARQIEKVHQENTSIIAYNTENALSCVLTLAFYSAREKFRIIREMPTGKGFADLVFIPWYNVDLPPVVLELKWNKDADTAIRQIKSKQYPNSLLKHNGKVLLCGISYDKETKKHFCEIEEVEKE